MSRQPNHRRARIGEKHRVVGGEIAKRRSQEFWTYRLDPWTLLHIVLFQLGEGLSLGDMLSKKTLVCLLADALKQRSHSRFHIADESQVQLCPAPNVLWVLIDLYFLHAAIRQKF